MYSEGEDGLGRTQHEIYSQRTRRSGKTRADQLRNRAFATGRTDLVDHINQAEVFDRSGDQPEAWRRYEWAGAQMHSPPSGFVGLGSTQPVGGFLDKVLEDYAISFAQPLYGHARKAGRKDLEEKISEAVAMIRAGNRTEGTALLKWVAGQLGVQLTSWMPVPWQGQPPPQGVQPVGPNPLQQLFAKLGWGGMLMAGVALILLIWMLTKKK